MSWLDYTLLALLGSCFILYHLARAEVASRWQRTERPGVGKGLAVKCLPIALLWAARGVTALCTLVVMVYAALALASCGGHGQDSQKGTTVIDQPKQEANCND